MTSTTGGTKGPSIPVTTYNSSGVEVGGGAAPTVDSGNSSSTPLTGGATFTGSWTDISSYATITLLANTDAVGQLFYDFSPDESTTSRTVTLSRADVSDFGIHALTPVDTYGRVRLVNGAGAQSTLSLATLLFPVHKQIVSRAAQTVNDYTDVQNVRSVTDIILDEARGAQANRTQIQKFGRNPDVGASTDEDIWDGGGIYPFLQAATTVRIKAGGDAADDAAGNNAREVTVVGLDENWAAASEAIATNGADVSSSTTTTFTRIYRAHVSAVGTYGAANAAAITIENTAGTADLAVIGVTSASSPLGLGQTEMAIYTVPAGKTAYVRRVSATVEGSKPADVFFLQREDADDTSAPMKSWRVWHVFAKLEGEANETFRSLPSFAAKTDVIVRATGPTGGAGISAEFDLVLVDE